MKSERALHPHFEEALSLKDQKLISLYLDLRDFVLTLCPECNELLYHTHALTSLYSISDKMSDGFCMIPIYTNHMNLGFTKGTLLEDPNQVLMGTGKLIRHIPIRAKEDYRNENVELLIKSAILFAIEDQTKTSDVVGRTISKIKGLK